MAARKPRRRTPAGPVCAVEGCDEPVYARGRCEPHYEDLARGRNQPPQTPGQGGHPSPLVTGEPDR